MIINQAKEIIISFFSLKLELENAIQKLTKEIKNRKTTIEKYNIELKQKENELKQKENELTKINNDIKQQESGINIELEQIENNTLVPMSNER